MPELTFAAGEKPYVCTFISVEQYRKYTEYMEKNNSEDVRAAVLFNLQIIKMIFHISEVELQRTDVEEQLVTAKMIHFVMQEVVTPKFLELNHNQEQVQQEVSAFDEYDETNGYNDTEKQENIWKICRDNLDRVIKLCIKGFHDSLTGCLQTDIMSLLDHVAFEMRTINE